VHRRLKTPTRDCVNVGGRKQITDLVDFSPHFAPISPVAKSDDGKEFVFIDGNIEKYSMASRGRMFLRLQCKVDRPRMSPAMLSYETSR
jgi:hypothetical protein